MSSLRDLYETLLSEDPQLNNQPLLPVSRKHAVAIGRPSEPLSEGQEPQETLLSEDPRFNGAPIQDGVAMGHPQMQQQETLLSEDPRFNNRPIEDIGNGRGAVIGLAQLTQPEQPRYSAKMGPIQMHEAQTGSRDEWNRDRKARVWASLQQKAVRGYGQPGEGSIPLSALPASLRGRVEPDKQGPAIGWLPSQLTPEERLMLSHLQGKGRIEADKAREEALAEMAAQRGGVRQ